MTIRSLEEEFRRLGLSEDETRRSLAGMGMLTEETEAGVDDDAEDGADFEESYLSQEADGEEDLDEDEDLDEGMTRMRTHKTSAAGKRKSRQYYKAHRMEIGRKRKKRAKSAAGKRAAKILARMPKGGARVRRVVSDKEVPSEGGLHESLLGDLGDLAEAIERDPKSRFEEFTESFNSIADLGELLAYRAITEDEDVEAAEIVIGLTVKAEDILREMDEMGGSLTPEEDAELDATLEEALEEVEAILGAFDLIAEDEESEEDEGEDFEEEFDGEDDDDDLEEGADEDDLEEDSITALMQQIQEAKGGKTQKRPPKAAKRKLLAPGKTISVKGASAWGKKHGKGAAKAQVRARKDVRNKEALLNYLKMVKAGVVAPGQKVNKGALKAKRMAGKGYKGKAKAG